jgi:hypothetical protein
MGRLLIQERLMNRRACSGFYERTTARQASRAEEFPSHAANPRPIAAANSGCNLYRCLMLPFSSLKGQRPGSGNRTFFSANSLSPSAMQLFDRFWRVT